MQHVLKDLEARMKAALEAMGREFASIRTGRASANLLDSVRVDYYGNPTPVNQMASVSVPDARTIVIQPWEPGQLKAIEKDKKAPIAEDDERRGHDQIQKTTDQYIARVDELLKKKEQEILSF